MDILLIFPLNESLESIVTAGKTPWKSKLNASKTIKKIDCVYPTGLLSIASYLRRHVPDANVKILDFNVVMNMVAAKRPEGFEGYGTGDFFRDALDSLESFNPELIGISTLFCSNYKDLGPLSSYLKERYPGSFTIAGGHLVAAVYKRVYEERMPIDAIAGGEGEIPVVELVKALKEGRKDEYLASAACWATAAKLKQAPEFKAERLLIDNLDEIPCLDFNALVFPEAYFNSSRYLFVIDSKSERKKMIFFSTRGCPHRGRHAQGRHKGSQHHRRKRQRGHA